MNAARAIILPLVVNVFSLFLAAADTPTVTGSWKIDVTFANDQHRFLRFDAQGEGKGTLTLTDPRSKMWGGASPSEAKWAPGEGSSVTFSGQVEFPLGNVGRDAGKLTLRGKFESPDLITGEADFSPIAGDGPSRHGTFKAVREKQ